MWLFSRHLRPAEENYDVGDREVLVVKLALKEWRHLLEAAEQPFAIWMDHKDPTYLRTAKRLSARQARGSLSLPGLTFLFPTVHAHGASNPMHYLARSPPTQSL